MNGPAGARPAPHPNVGAPLPAARAVSLFRVCLDRCTRAGLRLVINAPADVRAFSRGLRNIPERRIDPPAHAHWETAYRIFCNRCRQPHDRGSWQIMAVDDDDRAVAAITARFFCGEVVQDYLYVFTLLESAGPAFREQCERALADLFATCAQTGRTPAEVSHYAVTPGRHAALASTTLIRAIGALAGAFDAPLALVAADLRRGDLARLLRLGGAPFGQAGRIALPPFVYPATGEWLRLLLVDGTTFHARRRSPATGDLALLRTHCPVFSCG